MFTGLTLSTDQRENFYYMCQADGLAQPHIAKLQQERKSYQFHKNNLGELAS